MSLQRDFQLSEKGVQLEVRLEASNVFNRTTMTDPVATNANQLRTYVAGKTSFGFGYISPTATPGTYRPREGLALVKLRFENNRHYLQKRYSVLGYRPFGAQS